MSSSTGSSSLPAGAAPVKKIPGAAARKSQTNFQDSRTARKVSQTTTTGASRLSGSTSDAENNAAAPANALKKRAREDTSATSSSLKASKKEERDTASLRGRTEEADDAATSTTGASVAAPPPAGRGKGRGKGKGKGVDPNASVLSAVNVRAGNKPSSVASVQFGGGGKGKVHMRSLNNRQSTTTDSVDSDDDPEREESPNVKSVSSNGYNWEVEMLGLKPQDVKTRLSYHKSITTTIEREGKVETVRFRRGDKIWVLPDPQWLDEDGGGMDIEDLPDDEFWCATVLDACALDQRSQGEDSLGLLRIQWMYAPEHADMLKTLHKQYKEKIRQYRFMDGEFIDSDHIDFIGIETFAGFADGVTAFLRITGLTVDDEERLKPEHKRKKPTKDLYTRMIGWGNRERAEAAIQKKAKRDLALGGSEPARRGEDRGKR